MFNSLRSVFGKVLKELSETLKKDKACVPETTIWWSDAGFIETLL